MSANLQRQSAKYGVEWQDPKTATNCSVCNAKFSMTKRANNCRKCGRCVCSKCSANKVKLPMSQHAKRVCDTCFSAHGSVASEAEDATRRVLSDWMHRVLQGEHTVTNRLLDGATDIVSKDLLMQSMGALLVDELRRMGEANTMGRELANCKRGLIDFNAARVELVTSYPESLELYAVCVHINQTLDCAKRILAKRQEILSGVDVSSGQGLAEALELSHLSDAFSASWEQLTAVMTTIILSDIWLIVDQQLFKEGWENLEGQITSWVDSDLTLSCVEATFHDFFNDLLEWFTDSESFVRVAQQCLDQFSRRYIEDLLNGQLMLDTAGKTAARIRGDVRVLERCFSGYQALPRPQLQRQLQPLKRLVDLIAVQAAGLPDQVQGVVPVFGEQANNFVLGVLFMHPHIPSARQSEIAEDLRHEPVTPPEEIVLEVDLRPVSRAQPDPAGSPTAAAASAAASTLSPEAQREKLAAAAAAIASPGRSANADFLLAAAQATKAAEEEKKEEPVAEPVAEPVVEAAAPTPAPAAASEPEPAPAAEEPAPARKPARKPKTPEEAAELRRKREQKQRLVEARNRRRRAQEHREAEAEMEDPREAMPDPMCACFWRYIRCST